jgi:hypothetical protein
MPRADRVPSTPRKPASEFLIQVNRLQISLMIRDPYVAKAFRAAEDDGLAPSMAAIDRPRMLNGGAAERVLGQPMTKDDELGVAWWNALTKQERAKWSAIAGNTGRAKDAWEAFKRASVDQTPFHGRIHPRTLNGGTAERVLEIAEA